MFSRKTTDEQILQNTNYTMAARFGYVGSSAIRSINPRDEALALFFSEFRASSCGT